VQIQNEEYQAVHVDTNQGESIIIMRYERTSWWTKAFDVDAN